MLARTIDGRITDTSTLTNMYRLAPSVNESKLRCRRTLNFSYCLCRVNGKHCNTGEAVCEYNVPILDKIKEPIAHVADNKRYGIWNFVMVGSQHQACIKHVKPPKQRFDQVCSMDNIYKVGIKFD